MLLNTNDIERLIGVKSGSVAFHRRQNNSIIQIVSDLNYEVSDQPLIWQLRDVDVEQPVYPENKTLSARQMDVLSKAVADEIGKLTEIRVSAIEYDDNRKYIHLKYVIYQSNKSATIVQFVQSA